MRKPPQPLYAEGDRRILHTDSFREVGGVLHPKGWAYEAWSEAGQCWVHLDTLPPGTLFVKQAP